MSRDAAGAADGLDPRPAGGDAACLGELERLARQGGIPAADALLAAAAHGLTPDRQPPSDLTDEAARTAFLIRHLVRRPYSIGIARSEDLPALVTLETRCWAPELRTGEAVLARRILRYPEGQLVVRQDQDLVGVIYSQLIDGAEALDGATAATVDALHRADAGTVQLLAINVLPERQHSHLGDQLLEFMLIFRSLQDHVRGVVAVTRCKSFRPADGLPLADHIRARNGHGVLADPVLRFHELHGATIERIVPGYRPADADNDGCGVLVTYDIRNRRRTDLTAESAPAGAAAPPVDRDALAAEIRRAILACLGPRGETAFAVDRPLMDMGLDSADLLGLSESLSQRWRLPLAPTFFFERNTAAKIVADLADRLIPHPSGPARTSSPPRRVEPAGPSVGGSRAGRSAIPSGDGAPGDSVPGDIAPGDIAIVGMACRLPGGIDTPEALWRSLETGACVIGDLPAARWRWPDAIDPDGRHRGIARGGFLDDVAGFDAPFFRISPAEAETMDPQQRMLLELSWQAIEYAGYAPAELAGSQTGVFVGASGSDYVRLMEQVGSPVEAHCGVGGSMAVLANRISYLFDLQGPSLLVDTACSSSLVAVHEAVRSIRSGESAQALVGGINLMLHPATSIAFHKAGMLSKDGLCRSFDADANGYVRSEGAVVLLLKPLAAALAAGDRVHGVIKGTSSNHGGQAGGLTVPNPEQQARLLRMAWTDAGIDPSALSYLEAHGTGTPLGDPIEVRGMSLAIAGALPGEGAGRFRRCGLGSVKTNLGHLEAAAGIAGLLKVVLCLRHRRLPASLHFRRLNPQIRLDDTGLYVVDRLQPWQPAEEGGPLLAGVSSFGSGGANAHAVVAGGPADRPEPAAEEPGPVLFVLSARTRPQLADYADRFVAWLDTAEGRSVPLADLARQMRMGRPAMEERLALVVSSRRDLADGLARWRGEARGAAAAAPAGAKALTPDVAALTDGEPGRLFLRSLAEQGDLERIAALWRRGVTVDWTLLSGADRPLRRVAAPTYPFAKHRYWLPNATASQAAAAQPVVMVEPAAAELRTMPLAPHWRPVAVAADDAADDSAAPSRRLPSGRLLVVGADAACLEVLRAGGGGVHALEIDPADTVEALTRRLADAGSLDHVVWVAPPGGGPLIDAQRSGLRHLFRLVKALLASGQGGRALGLTAITVRTQAVCGDDPAEPAHAGVHGLTGALAKEFPRWTVRSLDLEDDGDVAAALLALPPADPEGDLLARRAGQWLRRVFVPVELPEATPAYRQGGVYVVIGGAGGLGAAWTRHVAERYRASVVWIGRRALDDAIRERIRAIAAVGPAPAYVSADATDPDALRSAFAAIRQSHPAIHGVILSAVGAFDRGIADMDEDRFQDILSVKIDAGVHLAEIVKDDPLDFLLFFSSIVALEKNGGLSGYAAGGAFADAFALRLARREGRCVRVVNWAHWDIGTGATIAEATRVRRRKGGHLPVQADAAWALLQATLGGPIPQVAVVRTSRPDALPMVEAGRRLSLDARPAPRCIDRLPALPDALRAASGTLGPVSLFNNPILEAHLRPLFAGLLRSAGLDDPAAVPAGPAFYRRWLEAGRVLLAEHSFAEPSSAAPSSAGVPVGGLEDCWRRWDAARRADLAAPDLQGAVELAEACLRALPDVLSGAVRSTDILFPAASMRRVEAVYRDNAVADHFNRILAEAVAGAVARRLELDPDARLRILEIGAGTGGTTSMVLPYLDVHRDRIAEYAYTDLSKAFLFHAESRFVGAHPFVRPMLFDVEKPPAAQGIDTQAYDLVIATNVLHATRNIRDTLDNAKAVLRGNGLLLLNEISTRSLFAHVTFGLLEGWWLPEDAGLRLPDSPGLTPENWRAVLRQAGFPTVAFPAPEAHGLGQQIIVAESDGAVCQPAIREPAAARRPAPAALRAQADGDLRSACAGFLTGVVAKVLRMSPEDIDAQERLGAYGLDSILVVQITEALRDRFPRVAGTLLFEAQTIEAVADHLIRTDRDAVVRATGRTEDGEPPAARPPAARPPITQPTAVAEPAAGAPAVDDRIAIIGLSCRFPQADSPDAFWRALAEGRDCIREVPADRWPLEGFHHPDPEEAIRQFKSYGKWGGFLDGVTEFDPLFFSIPPKEAAAIDPQERLFLQTAWQALEDAGYTRERLAKDFEQRLGVFVGVTRTGFDLFGPPLWNQGETVYPHTSFSSIANRVSFFLNARGPSMPVDTMCSSSLAAVHQACESLRAGECRVAIAGGVNVYLHPSGYVGLSAARMLSKGGACRSFGKGGDGFVPGEGVAALLLKPLSRAVADNDHIHAVIRATKINHGGRTNGYTVPNPAAQAEVIRDALRRGGVDARAVSYIEAHGTGTELGDPIEIAGLTEAFRHFTADTGFCALGSAKSNIGHLEASAGIAGLIKVVLQMRHGRIAPSLHAEEPNPNIDFTATPFHLQRVLADWTRPVLPDVNGDAREQPRIAGVSSFGAGGTNVHVVLEEHRPADRAPSAAGTAGLFLLSAANADRLKAYAARLDGFIMERDEAGDAPALADIAYTLQVGREAMPERLAFVARSLAEVREALAAYPAAGNRGAALHAANIRQHKAEVAAITADPAWPDRVAELFGQGRFDELLALWTKGLKIDWERLHRGRTPADAMPRRVGLPTYPFATTRFWLPEVKASPVAPPAAAPPISTKPIPTQPQEPAMPDVPAVPAALPERTLAKPADIALCDPAGFDPVGLAVRARPVPAKPVVALVPLRMPETPVRRENPVRTGEPAVDPVPIELVLEDHGGGVLSLRLDGRSGAAPGAGAALVDCLERVNALAASAGDPAKVLLVHGIDRMLGAGTPSEGAERAEAAIADCAVPVVAVMPGDRGGSGGGDAARVAAACDVAIGEADAFEQAHEIARASAVALGALKRQLRVTAAYCAEQEHAVRGLGPGMAPVPTDAPVPAGAPRPTALRSRVVSLTVHDNGVAVVTLHDRDSRNTSSPAFVEGVTEAFAHIAGTPEYKAVVLTGYDGYFACGGTREGLLAIQGGTARFTDEQSYSLPLLCDIPVIAAMQGHGIGAGWAMGLYCDRAVYAEESVYQSPYMLYGFTPGAGSTLIFPARLGPALGREVLLTAREHRGRDLRARGLADEVLPRADVFRRALAIAGHLARQPRDRLVREKAARTAVLRRRLPEVFAQELAMHDTTFVGNADVTERISRYFNAVADAVAPPPPPSPAAPSGPAPDAILGWLRGSLAEELSQQPDELDDDVAFIDLGMDSISAVTWVRKVNRQYGLALGATQVYDSPTLSRFAAFVLSRMGAPCAPAGEKVAAAPADASDADASDPDASDKDGVAVRDWLRDSLARELLIAPEELDEDATFIDLGLDSITAVTWIRALNKRFGLSIGATTVYAHPTLAAFHRHLLDLLSASAVAVPLAAEPLRTAPSAEAAPTVPKDVHRVRLAETAPAPAAPAIAAPAPVAAPVRPAIAIIGMAGQFPKAPDVGTFWRNILGGRDCVTEIPAARWPIDAFYAADRDAPGKTVCRRMGALDDLDLFDPLFFNISPSEAELMDPQQRLFLQNSWRCIEDAGYDPATLSGSLCGVFVGCAASDYGRLLVGQPPTAHGLIGESVAILPARIAYFLNLQGPCLAIDTACSASLVAIANACDSLALGNSDLALAGGVYVLNGPEMHVKMSKAGMLSPDGRCYTFDQRANGFVPGEGVGVLLLKRLDEAERDRDDIYAVIRGWGVNQDGRTNGITAPNQDSQARLEARVYERFGIDPDDIGLIEAHGTGTKLGDPIEVEALRAAFGRFTTREGYCALGSVKTNIGHLATAAGVAGTIKAALALRDRQLPPSINHDALNEHIRLDRSPFFVNTRLRPWPGAPGRRRHGAVSSFGFSGTNCHIVLAEAPSRHVPTSVGAAAVAVAAAGGPVVVPLSARSEAQLKAYARALCDGLSEPGEGAPMPLADLAATFQSGRAVLNWRLAVVAGSVAELVERLSRYAASAGGADDDCVVGMVRPKTVAAAPAGPGSGPDLEALTAWERMRTVARRWVAGEPVDWASVRGAAGRRRAGLPTYPFARERHWAPASPVSSEPKAPPQARAEAAAATAGWRHHSLPDAVDWRRRLRDRLAGRVLVIHADDTVAAAFGRLLGQLTQAVHPTGLRHPAFCGQEEIAAAVAAAKPDHVIVLGPIRKGATAGIGEIAHWLGRLSERLDGHSAEIFVFASTDRDGAERLAAALASQRRLTLVTQEDDAGIEPSLQRLLREWLAADGAARIRYDRGVRLTHPGAVGMTATAAAPADGPWIVRKEWREAAVRPAASPGRRGTALVLVNRETRDLAGTLFAPGDFAAVILAGDGGTGAETVIDFGDPEAARAAGQRLAGMPGGVTHLIDLSDLHGTPRDHDADGIGRMALYQALVAAGADIAILHVTMGLQAFRASRMSLAGATMAGLVRMLSADYRHVAARTLDIDPAAWAQPARLRTMLLREMDGELRETELLCRDFVRFAPALSAAAPEAGGGRPLALRPDGVYVVAGGTSGVGLEIARGLASRGGRRLLLLGVTPLPPRGEWRHAATDPRHDPALRARLRDLIELEKAVDHLEVQVGPLTRIEPLRACLQGVRDRLGPIRGVVHSAAVYSDPATPGFADKRPDGVRRVFEPKIQGIQALDALFRDDPLEFFVSFCSLAALLPSLARGASDYAAANAFVERFMAFRRHGDGRGDGRGVHRAILWPDWNEAGALTRIGAAKAAVVEDMFRRIGMRSFGNAEGVALFEAALAQPSQGAIVIACGDRRRFDAVAPRLMLADPWAAEPAAEPGADPGAADSPSASILPHLEAWEAERRSGTLVPVQRIAEVIGLDEIRRLEPHLIQRIHALLRVDGGLGSNQGDDPEPAPRAAVAPAPVEAAVEVAVQSAVQAARPDGLAGVIAETVREVLKLKSIESDQSFQSYGLDSISAMVLATRLDKKLTAPVPPQWFIEHCTVEALSRHLAAQGNGCAADRPPVMGAAE
ncbi:SDR family NAD(P)-dependent oxidoreductase [Azospirillum argentinense]|uniref:SDR family NAD(P)-dependent oxidoreductase n=1 Tax=Azospirillum argentinense TaxID=2970906 RepID=UPI0032DF0E47